MLKIHFRKRAYFGVSLPFIYNVQMSLSISAQGFSWEYIKFGKGPEILFAFHGFDNDANDFRIFEKAFGERYTIVAVNLFFHGKSDTPTHHAEDEFTGEILQDLFNRLLYAISCERFSFLGFSLGGRIIMELTKHFAHRIDRILLLAPDGLKISPWYVFITNSAFGKKLFKRIVYNPNRFLRLSKFFYKTGIIGEKQYLFALANFDTLEKRKKVFNVLMIFRNILPKPEDVGTALKKNPVPIDIYFGRRDTIIRETFGKRFNKKSDYETKIHLLDAGHNLMKDRIVEELIPWLQDKKKVSE